MTIDEIIKYAFESPENTNPNVLRSMLNEIEGEGGDTPAPSGEETMVININDDQLNKTWQEINDALNQDIIVYCRTGVRGMGRMYVIETFADEAKG